MSVDTVGPADAPLQSLVGLGFNVGHESAGDLQTLIQSAMSGIRKEVDLHMDFMGTEHVEHKMDHQLQRKMVRFLKCSAVTLHESQTFYVGDTEPESDHVNCLWSRKYGILTMGGYSWLRKKNSAYWFLILLANWINVHWLKKPSAQKAAWNHKGKLRQPTCRPFFIYLGTPCPFDQDLAHLVETEATLGAASQNPILRDSHPDHAEIPANSFDQDGEATMPMAM